MTDTVTEERHIKRGAWIAVAVCLVLICAAGIAAFVLTPRLSVQRTYNQACALLESGDYTAARELFAALDYSDSAEKVLACDYLAATELMADGEYEAAKSAFTALGDYSDSADMCMRCDYLSAQALMDGGDYAGAVGIFQTLGGYEDSELKAETCLAGMYEAAKLHMRNSRFQSAAEVFELLGDYKDSTRQLNNCQERLAAEAAFTGNELFVSYNIVDYFHNGTLYRNPLGYIFVPDEVNADTAWLVYFPGGNGFGVNLNVPCVYMEHQMFSPNAVMIYLFDNGWFDMRGFTITLEELMKQAALECGIWFHDVVTVGSSNGCYPAMIASPVLYSEAGITVDAVVAFDPGNEWDTVDFALLTPEESDTMAEAGTRVYLLEQRDFSSYAMTVSPVADLVHHGCDIIVVECDNDGHNHIGPDAIRAGFYDWAMGQVDGLKPIGVTNMPYVIRMIKLYPDGSLENLEVPYLEKETE